MDYKKKLPAVIIFLLLIALFSIFLFSDSDKTPEDGAESRQESEEAAEEGASALSPDELVSPWGEGQYEPGEELSEEEKTRLEEKYREEDELLKYNRMWKWEGDINGVGITWYLYLRGDLDYVLENHVEGFGSEYIGGRYYTEDYETIWIAIEDEYREGRVVGDQLIFEGYKTFDLVVVD